MIADIIKTKTTDKWLSLFRESDVPSGPVNTMDKVFDMEQIQTRGMQIQMDHPLSSGKIDLVGSPIKLSETPASYDNPPPICGEHTQEILEKLLGLSEEEIEDLKKKNIIEAKQ